MKKNLIKSLLFSLITTTVCLMSCNKSDSEPASIQDTQLTKITAWNPSTGAELPTFELTYNANGIVSAAKGSNNDSYTVEYDATGKLTKVNKTNPNGRTTVYTVEYNANGKINKVNENNASAGTATGTNVITYEYNATGKISKKVNTFTGGSSTVEYTWMGDNISEAKFTALPGTYLSIAKYTYDDKKNPYSLGGDITTFVFFGSPASKNNITEISTTNGSTTSLQKRAYEYNTAGYATSMKLMDGSNEGSKFYYNK